MSPLGRLRWFLGRLISPARTLAPGGSPTAETGVDRDADSADTDDD